MLAARRVTPDRESGTDYGVGPAQVEGGDMDVKRLQSLPLFQGVSDDELAKIADRFESAEMLAGSSLAKQDDFAYKFFIVLEGQVEVYRDFDHVADLGPGEFFGEMGVIEGGKRNARVTACTSPRAPDGQQVGEIQYMTAVTDAPLVCGYQMS